MKFDFNWFLTVPGMLITGGILLLIIALIILMVTTSKKKKGLDEDATDMGSSDELSQVSPDMNMVGVNPEPLNNSSMPEVNSPVVGDSNDSIMNIPDPIPVEQPQMSVEPDMGNVASSVVEAPAVTPEAIPAVDTSMMAPEVAPAVEEPTVAPEVLPAVETPVVAPEVAPAVETPVVTPEVAPAVETPVVASEVAPVVETPTVAPEITPVTETSAVAPEALSAPAEPVIYGGANPTVSNINVSQPQPQQHQIYGGANPLENTQSVPISNIAGPNAQASVQTPVAEPTLITPQIEPIQSQNIQQ